ncbi:MAG: hypothetical protein OEU94_12080 [Aquincola sp.]|nr:hypothetical protein [Aquincola sp.]MDH5329860.1 hypothetical protein [Aquincola sp.]
MTRFSKRRLFAPLCATAVLVAAIGAAQAAADAKAPCRDLVGINTLDVTSPPPPPNAWTVVADNGDSFKSRRTVESCSVKVVVSVVKGKPLSTTLTLAEKMTQDECSMYSYLSSIDSKLVQGKFAEAYTAATSMVTKVDSLGSKAQLIDPGYTAIRGAAAAVQACIAPLY